MCGKNVSEQLHIGRSPHKVHVMSSKVTGGKVKAVMMQQSSRSFMTISLLTVTYNINLNSNNENINVVSVIKCIQNIVQLLS